MDSVKVKARITKKMADLIYRSYVRNHVTNRDEALCVHCGKIGFDVHHVIHRAQGIFPLINPQNCVTLCRACHTLLHAKPEIAREVEKKAKKIVKQHYKSEFTCVKDVLRFFGIV